MFTVLFMYKYVELLNLLMIRWIFQSRPKCKVSREKEWPNPAQGKLKCKIDWDWLWYTNSINTNDYCVNKLVIYTLVEIEACVKKRRFINVLGLNWLLVAIAELFDLIWYG